MAIFLGSSLHDRGDFGVMDMANIGEEVMLDLKIESADIPVEQVVVASEIGGGIELVDDPVGLDDAFGICGGLGDAFYHMRQLEDHTQDEATCEMHEQPSQANLPPSKISEQQRQADENAEMEDFDADHLGQFLVEIDFLLLNDPLPTVFKKLREILQEHGQREQGVDKQCVDVLVAMDFAQWRMLAEPQRTFGFDVFVEAIDIGIGVVEHIVLHFPSESAIAQQVHGSAKDAVDPFFARERLMRASMHDAHADASKPDSGDNWHCGG